MLTGIAVRRWLLERGGGTVECALRAVAAHEPWRLGVGRYTGDELRWYRIFGLCPRPSAVLVRRGLVVAGRRRPDPVESAALGEDLVIVECRGHDGGDVELAMSESAFTGFLAWVEAAPPGANIYRHS